MTREDYFAELDRLGRESGLARTFELVSLVARIYRGFGFDRTPLRDRAFEMLEEVYGPEFVTRCRCLWLEAERRFEDIGGGSGVRSPRPGGPSPVLSFREPWPD